jgi:small-conductance mechanosensitive channel
MNIKDGLAEGYALLDVPLITVGSTQVTAATLVLAVIIVLLTFWGSRILRRAISRVFKARGMGDEGTVGVASRLVHYLVLFTGLGVALHTVGFNLTALFAAGALFAVGLGFAMQNLTANFVSGVILLLERAIKPGDVLEVEGRMVKVVEMGIRATIARTLDHEELVIPNSLLVQSTVKNYTLRDRFYRVRVLVGVVYASDLRLVRRTLESAANGIEWRSSAYKPRVLLTEFGDSSVNFEISVWIEDPWRVRQRKSDLHETAWWSLKDAGIIIAFPQLDLHLDPPVVESLQSLRVSA